MTTSVRSFFLLALPALVFAAPAIAATSYVVTDVESLDKLTVDATVTCPIDFSVLISGADASTAVGRAPSAGECGLDYVLTPGVTPVDATATTDHLWAQPVSLPFVLDLVKPSDRVFVFNAADHLPFPEEGIEWTVWASDTPDATSFPSGWTLGELCAIFRQGWTEPLDGTGQPLCPGDDADDYVGLYSWTRAYRFVAIYANFSITIFTDQAHTLWSAAGDDDGATPGWQSTEAELDAVGRPLGPPPTIDVGPDLSICKGLSQTFSLSATGGTIYKYAWDTDGDGVADASGATVTRQFDVVGTYTMSVDVIGACGCASDSVQVEVKECTVAVAYTSARATLSTAGVRVAWSTAVEVGTLGFELWWRDGSGGQGLVPGFVFAQGSGASYEVVDGSPEALAGWRTAYRVVERTPNGVGDATSWLAVDPGGSASRHRAGHPGPLR